MRRADLDSGFFICWLLNMVLNWEIGAVALALSSMFVGEKKINPILYILAILFVAKYVLV